MKFNRIVALVLAGFVVSRPASLPIEYNGAIDASFVQILIDAPEGSTIELSSRGGRASMASQAAEIVEQKGFHLIIGEVCASACVDYLFPAAESVTISTTSIVAMHGNPIVDYEGLQEHGFGHLAGCRRPWAERLQAIWSRNGVDDDAWRETLDRLGFAGVSVAEGTECGRVDFQRAFWIPTSLQLRSMYGDNVIGSACADDRACIETRIAHRWRGIPLVVGDVEIRF